MKDYVEVYAPLMVFNHVISSHIDLVKQNELNSIPETYLDHQNSRNDAILLCRQFVCWLIDFFQIIMSKPAGGPKPKDNPNWDED